jgi:hypothetical protein
MADRPLIVVYLLGICIGGAVAFYGFVIFVGIRPGGTLMGMVGLLLGFCLIATAWVCVASLRQKIG